MSHMFYMLLLFFVIIIYYMSHCSVPYGAYILHLPYVLWLATNPHHFVGESH